MGSMRSERLVSMACVLVHDEDVLLYTWRDRVGGGATGDYQRGEFVRGGKPSREFLQGGVLAGGLMYPMLWK